MDGNKLLSERAAEINGALSELCVKTECEQERLFEAARYSLLAGGKRLRPVLMLEFYRICGGDAAEAQPFACALEMIHTYSLIHDDLPCMDNDDLRRGRPTSHRVFGEAYALLAGDALLNGAYELMLETAAKMREPGRGISAAREIAKAAGALGMIGGQTLDLENEKADPDVARLERTDRLKTGALFRAACVSGAILAGADGAAKEAARTYAENLGLAFQIVDDLLDVSALESELGKTVGSDKASGKRTYVDFYGADGCRALARELTGKAVRAAEFLPESEFLVWLAENLADRAK